MSANSESQLQQDLLNRVKARRASIDAYVRRIEPRADRQANLSIISSGVAAALTAGPAIGGTRFSTSLQHLLALPDDSLVWQSLCLLAAVVSVVAAVSTSLYKSRDLASQLSKAETAASQLEGLETLLEFGQLPVAEAVKLYQQYVSGIPFIPEQA